MMPSKVKSKIRRDPERTKAKLLDAGVALFSAHGYHGVSVDRIVAEASCNKRMLYHYYKNKDGLYVEVLRHVFGKLEAYEIEGLEGSGDTVSSIKDLLARFFDYLAENPDFVKLLMWENLDEGRFLDSHPNIFTKTPLLARLSEILERGRASGEIDTNADVRHLLILLIGTCFIYFSNRHTLKHSLDLDLFDPSVLGQGLHLAQEVVIGGLIKNKA
jgi:TetR/AcrR family transcriptional regulator